MTTFSSGKVSKGALTTKAALTKKEFIRDLSSAALKFENFMHVNNIETLIRKKPDLKSTSKFSKKCRLYIRDMYVGRCAYIVMVNLNHGAFKINKEGVRYHVTGIYKRIIKYRWTDVRNKHADDMAYIFILGYNRDSYKLYQEWANPEDPKLSDEEYSLFSGLIHKKSDLGH